ncbi:hypothetical protein [Halobacterium bonnevillei]|nr:hypothetical protein [Halobacterium bonnevillei]
MVATGNGCRDADDDTLRVHAPPTTASSSAPGRYLTAIHWLGD